MKYMSEDGIIFDIMSECEEYEIQTKKKEMEERERKAKLEEEKKKWYEEIQNKSEELDTLVSAFERDYGIRISYNTYPDPFRYFLSKSLDGKNKRGGH